MIRINNIKTGIRYKDQDILEKIKKVLRVPEIKNWRLVKRSLDSRDKNKIQYVFSVDVELENNSLEKKIIQKVNNKNIMLTKDMKYQFPYQFSGELLYRPIIIGAGPAGYFAALKLSEAGFKPILFERGKSVYERSQDVDSFWKTGKLNPSSNVSFGEGGAGTFSDGKLNTGIKDPSGRIRDVLDVFYRYGADESILYDAKPHVGTDVLKNVMENMRSAILAAGGEIHFNSQFVDISCDNSDMVPVYKVSVHHMDQESDVCIRDYYTYALIFAIGHSARDTFQLLYDRGFQMEQKPFAVGLRIEHKREDINRSRYGDNIDMTMLPTADYKLTHHAANGRSVFSFCMCPGGYVVNASSEEGGLVVNGMSYSKRDAENSNSAIVCNITPSDYPGDLPMDAVAFQRNLEQKFYSVGNGKIPVQTYGDFKKGEKTVSLGEIAPCIKGDYSLANLKECLPEFVADAIIEGIDAFSRQIEGFNRDDAVLSGIESRTSSPIRILRDENFMSNYPGVIPCGEGAGYAGGITSAAVDGIKAAEACAAYLLKPEMNGKDES